MEYYLKIGLVFLILTGAGLIFFLINRSYLKNKEALLLTKNKDISSDSEKPKILNELKEEVTISEEDWNDNEEEGNLIGYNEIKNPYESKTLDELFKKKIDNQDLDQDTKNLLN